MSLSVVLGDGPAVRFLIAGGDQRVERQGVILGRGVLLLDQSAEHAQFDWMSGFSRMQHYCCQDLLRHGELQFFDSLPRDARNLEERQFRPGGQRRAARSTFSASLRHIHFARHHQHGLARQFFVEALQFAHQRFEIVHGIAPGFGHIDQMHQQLRAFHVLQELNAQPAALVRAFDDAGNIGHHERPHDRAVCTTPRFGSSVVNG